MGSPAAVSSHQPSLDDLGRHLAVTHFCVVDLEYSSAGVGSAAAKFPHLSGLSGFKLPEDARAKLPAILKSQIAVSITDDIGLRPRHQLVQAVLDDVAAGGGQALVGLALFVGVGHPADMLAL